MLEFMWERLTEFSINRSISIGYRIFRADTLSAILQFFAKNHYIARYFRMILFDFLFAWAAVVLNKITIRTSVFF